MYSYSSQYFTSRMLYVAVSPYNVITLTIVPVNHNRRLSARSFGFRAIYISHHEHVKRRKRECEIRDWLGSFIFNI